MKKLGKAVIALFTVVIFFNFYGFYITNKVLNILMPKMCIEDICVNKPNDWFPLIVKKNDESKLFGLIPEKYFFTNIGETHLQGIHNVIYLEQNKNTTVMITKYYNNLNIGQMKNISLQNTFYFQRVDDLSFFVLVPEKKILLLTSFSDPELIDKLITSL